MFAASVVAEQCGHGYCRFTVVSNIGVKKICHTCCGKVLQPGYCLNAFAVVSNIVLKICHKHNSRELWPRYYHNGLCCCKQLQLLVTLLHMLWQGTVVMEIAAVSIRNFNK